MCTHSQLYLRPPTPVQTFCLYTSDSKLTATVTPRRRQRWSATAWTEVGSRSLLLINKVSTHHSGPSPAFASHFQGHLALPTPETRDHGINQVSLLPHCQLKSQLSLFCWISNLLLSAFQLQKCCCCCLLSRSIFPCGIIALKNIFL